MKWLLILISLISLKTCDKGNNNDIQKGKETLNSEYFITSLNGKNVSDFKLTIAFNDSTKQVSGFSGCNRFFGPFTVEDNILKMGPLASTRKMCPPDFSNLESTMLDILSKENTFSLEGATFKLLENENILIEASK